MKKIQVKQMNPNLRSNWSFVKLDNKAVKVKRCVSVVVPAVNSHPGLADAS